MMRATRALLVALSVLSSLPFQQSLAFGTAARTSTSTTRSTPRQQPPRARAWRWTSRPRLVAAERGENAVGGRAGLHAAATGGDDAVSVRTETHPDAQIEEEGHAPLAGAASTSTSTSTSAPHLGAYWDILRPQNIPSSFGLVAAGALVASHSVGSMLDPKVGEEDPQEKWDSRRTFFVISADAVS